MYYDFNIWTCTVQSHYITEPITMDEGGVKI